MGYSMKNTDFKVGDTVLRKSLYEDRPGVDGPYYVLSVLDTQCAVVVLCKDISKNADKGIIAVFYTDIILVSRPIKVPNQVTARLSRMIRWQKIKKQKELDGITHQLLLPLL